MGDSVSIADAPGSSCKVLKDKLDECEGLTIAEQDAIVVGQCLQELAKNIRSREHANVGLMVTKLLPDQDTSSRTAHLDPSAWDHVMCGWDFAALAKSGAASPADESQLALLATKWEEGQNNTRILHNIQCFRQTSMRASLQVATCSRACWAIG